MEYKFWHWAVSFFVGLLVGLYTAFVAMCFWNWFAVRVLNINSISFLEMIGIVWLVGLFTHFSDKDESKWKVLFAAVEACVPDHNREMLAQAMHEQKEQIWTGAATKAFWEIVGITFTLTLGFGLHVLIG